MRHVRVLVVDDSVVVRRVVSDVLSADPAIDVVGVAAHGGIALHKLAQLAPDAVTLDIEMPELDGLATLREIRKTHPTLPVIMFSTLTARGAEATLEALALGANDYVTKPSHVGQVDEAVQHIREQLLPRIKVFCGIAETAPADVQAEPGVVFTAPPSSPRPVAAVGIGVSTGGPNALATVLPALPADLPVPVFIAQHMPPVFTASLAERLDATGPMSVREAVDGAVAQEGEVWIAPGGHHLSVEPHGTQLRVRVHQDPPVNSCRPSADVLFASLAGTCGPGTLGLILTGMGCDGLAGCRTVREAGGQVFVQDRATSTVWGMPGYVARNGLADGAWPIDEIAGEVVRRVRVGRRPQRLSSGR